MGAATFSPTFSRRAAMFLFNRSGVAVGLAILIAGLPVLIQYF
jgi:hypothetical protein